MYDPWNNIFVDLKQVQKRMVEIYGLSFQERKGILKIVTKLDVCEIVKEKKIEIVMITLMNREVDTSVTMVDTNYFSVQSKKHVVVGSFEVCGHFALYILHHNISIYKSLKYS